MKAVSLLYSRRTWARLIYCGSFLYTYSLRQSFQDLSNIAFPVTFNEPLTLLQRAAEEMEYFDLLDKAALSSDEIERISYISAFAVSGYACTKHRSGRKGLWVYLSTGVGSGS